MDSSEPAVGEATVAERNRQRETRLRIIQGFVRLGIPYHRWPDFVREYWADPAKRKKYQHAVFPGPFQASAFDRLNQSAEDWAEIADKEWERHRTGFLERCEYWVKAGVDDEIPKTMKPRGPGSQKVLAVGRLSRFKPLIRSTLLSHCVGV